MCRQTDKQTDRQTHVAGGTELPLAVLDLWAELLQQSLLDPPDGGGLSSGLQRHLDPDEGRRGEEE